MSEASSSSVAAKSLIDLASAAAKPHEEDIVYAEIEPPEAKDNYVVVPPGELKVDFTNNRRPEFDGPSTQPLAELDESVPTTPGHSEELELN